MAKRKSPVEAENVSKEKPKLTKEQEKQQEFRRKQLQILNDPKTPVIVDIFIEEDNTNRYAATLLCLEAKGLRKKRSEWAALLEQIMKRSLK